MSYRIEYSPQKNKFYPSGKRKSSAYSPFVWIGCLVLVYAVFALDLAGLRSDWFSFLDEVAMRLRSGTGIGQAVAACCAEFLKNAKVS